MVHDLMYAFRTLRRSPGFAAAAVATFALGIGANTAIFSIVDATVLRPLPYDRPDRLVTFTLHDTVNGRTTTGVMPRDFLDWRDRHDVFERVGVSGGGLRTLLGSGEPEELRIVRYTAGYFEMLHTRMALGRSFTEDDEQPGGAVAIISHGFWQARFAGAPDVIGKTLRLDDQTYAIIGVLPAEFQHPAGAAGQTGVFLPMTFTDDDRRRGVLQSMAADPVGRLRDGVTVAQAQAAMSQLQASLDGTHATFNKGFTTVELTPLLDEYVGDARPGMLTLLGAVALVLLIACANVANLLLAHGTTRAREMAVRGALGASRWRLARQSLAEALLLSSIGSACGWLVAWWGVAVLRAALPASIPRAANVGLDTRVLLFTLSVAVATGLLCGLLPAVAGSRVDFVSGLKEGAPGATTGRAGRRVRRTLVRAEIALAVILVAGAGLFIKSFMRLLRVDQGFDASGLASLHVSGPRGDAVANLRFMLAALAAVRTVPGVEAALTESGGPFTGGFSSFPVTRPGSPPPARGDESQMIRYRKVSAGFLELLHVPLVRGRTFTSSDRVGAPPVAVVNQLAARRYWNDRDPIGQPLTINATTYTIVGIVGDMRYGGPASAAAPEAFLPFEQTGQNGGTIVFRGPANSTAAVKAAIWRVNAGQPITNTRTSEEMFARATASRRFNMLLMSIFAALALTIAATGIYGVIAFMVQQRTREVGVRLALGAGPSQVVALFLREGIRILLAGLAGGAVGAWWLSKTVQGFLFQVDPRDPLVFVIVASGLAIVAIMACWIPARRAARVDPLVALRTQ